MYQLGDFYSYELRCELFEFADEEIETGVAEIDAIELEQAAAIKLIMDPGGTGDFTVGEEVVGDEFLAFATAIRSSGGTISSITINDGGAHYKTATPPSVTITAAPTSGGLDLFNTATSTGSYTNTTGTGYTAGTYTTTNTTGTGSGAIATVNDVSSDGGLSVSGGDLVFSINNRGAGYSAGDVLRIDGGDDNAYVRIVSVLVTRSATATATVSSSGIVSAITITDPGLGYTFTPTVTIDYSPKDNRAEVKSWNSSTRELQVINRTGVFTTAETITGLTSGAKWSPESYDQTLALNNTNSTYDQSLTIETESDNIIDFTEVNPFGEF